MGSGEYQSEQFQNYQEIKQVDEEMRSDGASKCQLESGQIFLW